MLAAHCPLGATIFIFHCTVSDLICAKKQKINSVLLSSRALVVNYHFFTNPTFTNPFFTNPSFSNPGFNNPPLTNSPFTNTFYKSWFYKSPFNKSSLLHSSPLQIFFFPSATLFIQRRKLGQSVFPWTNYSRNIFSSSFSFKCPEILQSILIALDLKCFLRNVQVYVH